MEQSEKAVPITYPKIKRSNGEGTIFVSRRRSDGRPIY